ncbi:MAG: NUDIX hydrolase [Bacilli bacterium]
MKEKDINVKICDVLLNIRAVAVIEKDGKVLFQKRKQDEFWALPGGKVRVGEQSVDTIKRELQEELNINRFEIKRCNSVSEYFFTFDKTDIHQYIFSYIVNVENDEWICFEDEEFNGVEKTENLVFKWFDINNLDNAPIKPDFLKGQIDKINNNEVIFTTYIEK